MRIVLSRLGVAGDGIGEAMCVAGAGIGEGICMGEIMGVTHTTITEILRKLTNTLTRNLGRTIAQ